MKKDMIDNLTLTRKERRNILRGGNRIIRASERRMKEKGFVVDNDITQGDIIDYLKWKARE